MRALAYVIHTRAFQDEKVLLDLLTQDQGLIRGVWRLAKKEARVIPGPFLCYDIECSGRTDLKTIRQLESVKAGKVLEGLPLYAALYSHELIAKLLPLNLPLPNIYSLYQWLIDSLASGAPIAPLLRRFEMGLFDELGMAINLSTTGRGQEVQEDTLYQFDQRFGLRPYYGEQPKLLPVLFVEGRLARAYHQGEWMNKAVLNLAKELHRHWIDGLLNGKPVAARKLLPKQAYQGERLFGVPIFRY